MMKWVTEGGGRVLSVLASRRVHPTIFLLPPSALISIATAFHAYTSCTSAKTHALPNVKADRFN